MNKIWIARDIDTEFGNTKIYYKLPVNDPLIDRFYCINDYDYTLYDFDYFGLNLAPGQIAEIEINPLNGKFTVNKFKRRETGWYWVRHGSWDNSKPMEWSSELSVWKYHGNDLNDSFWAEVDENRITKG